MHIGLTGYSHWSEHLSLLSLQYDFILMGIYSYHHGALMLLLLYIRILSNSESSDLSTDVPSSMSKFFNVDVPRHIVCFLALRPKSTAMVIAGQSVHLTTLFPGQA